MRIYVGLTIPLCDSVSNILTLSFFYLDQIAQMQEQAATIRGQGDGEDSVSKFQEKQAADITEVCKTFVAREI